MSLLNRQKFFEAFLLGTLKDESFVLGIAHNQVAGSLLSFVFLYFKFFGVHIMIDIFGKLELILDITFILSVAVTPFDKILCILIVVYINEFIKKTVFYQIKQFLIALPSFLYRRPHLFCVGNFNLHNIFSKPIHYLQLFVHPLHEKVKLIIKCDRIKPVNLQTEVIESQLLTFEVVLFCNLCLILGTQK